MAAKLESVFKNPNWWLGFKAAVCALALFWNPFLFLGVSAFFYFSSKHQVFVLLPSFIIFSVLSIVSWSLIFAAPIFAGVFFYFILGLKDYFFVNRQAWYSVLNLSLASWAGVVAFSYPDYLPWLGLAHFLLLYEAIRYLTERASYLYAFAGGFILYQIIWITAILPIGFVSRTALAVLFYYIIRELFFLRLYGKFSNINVLRLSTILLVVSTGILLISRWTI